MQCSISVAITACAQPGHTIVTKDKPVHFSSIITAYGMKSVSPLKKLGIFICEKAGLYFISLAEKSDANFHIYKNSEYLIDLYTAISNTYHSGTASAVTSLAPKDEVSVEPAKDSQVFSYIDRQSTCITIVKIR